MIAQKCLELISEGDTMILDSGSTTTEIAKKLRGMQRLTVITNALNIALMLGAEHGIEVIVTGGEFKPPTLSLTGQKAADFFRGLNVQKLFLATAGISLKSGLTYPSISDLVVKRAMIEAAETCYLVADSTKIGKTALASLGALSLIDYIITDPDIEEKHRQVFRDHEIELIFATLVIKAINGPLSFCVKLIGSAACHGHKPLTKKGTGCEPIPSTKISNEYIRSIRTYTTQLPSMPWVL